MTKKHRWIAPLLVSITASVLLVSCVDPGYSGGGHSPRSYHSSVYATLPNTYAGNAYYYNGRYYSGGWYETGRYHNRGRNYNNRYFHNGQYYYGGKYQKHAAKSGGRNSAPDYGQDRDSSRRRDVPESLKPFNRTRGQMPAVQSRYY